jgi:hypothetical protein
LHDIKAEGATMCGDILYLIIVLCEDIDGIWVISSDMADVTAHPGIIARRCITSEQAY